MQTGRIGDVQVSCTSLGRMPMSMEGRPHQEQSVATIHAALEAGVSSDRQREVLHGLALGHTNQDIGAKLYISLRTVDTRRAQIMRKLQTRAELVLFALPNDVIGSS
jgi:DNA-binding NarL/FixJ family response regulator